MLLDNALLAVMILAQSRRACACTRSNMTSSKHSGLIRQTVERARGSKLMTHNVNTSMITRGMRMVTEAYLHVKADRAFGQDHVVGRAREVVNPAGRWVCRLPQGQLCDDLPYIAAHMRPKHGVVPAKLQACTTQLN